MTNAIVQVGVFFLIVVAVSVPLGLYMARVFNDERTFIDPVLRPVERFIYKVCGIRPATEMTFATPAYFHSRPSAAGDKGYDAANSSGSNLGPTNKTLISTVQQRVKDVIEANPGVDAHQIPIDMVTSSGSGLDPEISPASADLQVARVARARGLGDDDVRLLVRQNTRTRYAGVLGEPGVNVLTLNLAVDQLSPRKNQTRASR